MDGVGISENPCCHVGEEFYKGEFNKLEWSVFVCGHPRPQEHYFDVEKNEENRNEIELDGEPFSGVSHWCHAAFVGSILIGGVSFWTQNPTNGRKDNA